MMKEIKLKEVDLRIGGKDMNFSAGKMDFSAGKEINFSAGKMDFSAGKEMNFSAGKMDFAKVDVKKVLPKTKVFS